jgi:hypothetical protein
VKNSLCDGEEEEEGASKADSVKIIYLPVHLRFDQTNGGLPKVENSSTKWKMSMPNGRANLSVANSRHHPDNSVRLAIDNHPWHDSSPSRLVVHDSVAPETNSKLSPDEPCRNRLKL